MNHRPSRAIPFWVWLLFLAFVVLVACWLLKSRRPSPAAPALELNRTNLFRVHKLWYQANHTNPFTGILVEYYPAGALMSRSVVSNGQLNGLSEGWFTNRQMQIRETYRANVSDGLRTRWYPNGRKLSEATIQQGKIEGTFRRWHQDGSLAEEIPMKDGQQAGVGRVYYVSGFLQAEIEMRDGKMVSKKTWKDGEQKAN
jgi:antitoxin component YwqK of YwqJK toxin-antitoxin module